jgi:hypothetical protein
MPTTIARPVNYFAAAPRYTTTATVKARLRIPTGNTDFDARISQAIISAEIGIDAELGRSFPDLGSRILDGDYVYRDSAAAPAGGELGHDLNAAALLSQSTLDLDSAGGELSGREFGNTVDDVAGV